MTHHDAYSLARIDETLDSLAHTSDFTTLHLASGYWQVELEESVKERQPFLLQVGTMNSTYALWLNQCPRNLPAAHGVYPCRVNPHTVPHLP